MRHILLASAVCAALGFAGTARAVLMTGSGTLAGNSVSASADFQISGNTLSIVLKNTSPGNAQEAPGSTLTGIAFSFQNTKLALVPVHALVNTPGNPASIVNSSSCTPVAACTGTNIDVGGEFGLDNGTYSATQDVIESSGFITTGLAGNIGNFEPGGAAGTDLNSNAGGNLDGIDFGIISNSAGPFNGGLSGRPLIQDTVVLTLAGVGGDLTNPGSLTGVTFLYGTAAGEGSIAGSCSGGSCLIIPGGGGAVPEPATLGLLGTALLGLAAARRRKQSN